LTSEFEPSHNSAILWLKSNSARARRGAFEFGLWFGATSPVDTFGAPDQTVDYVSGQGEYQAARAQTAPEYVAVAAYTDTEQCPAAEIFMDWDSLAPVSPPDQYATQQA
jgi:hypothetical protein